MYKIFTFLRNQMLRNDIFDNKILLVIKVLGRGVSNNKFIPKKKMRIIAIMLAAILAIIGILTPQFMPQWLTLIFITIISIIAIIDAIECPRDFACYKSGFGNLSKVEIMADGKLIECLEENGRHCRLGFAFGAETTFCLCPLRSYTARNFHK